MFEAQGLEYSLVSLYTAIQVASGTPRGSDTIRQYAPAAASADRGQAAIAKLREVQQLLAAAAEAVHTEAIHRLTASGVSRAQIEAGSQVAVEQQFAEALERA